MNALAAVHPPGLDDYLAQLEERLQATVASHRGTVAEAGAESLAAGGKRLRPLLVFLTAPAEVRLPSPGRPLTLHHVKRPAP